MKETEICEHFNRHKILSILLISPILLMVKLYRDAFCSLFSSKKSDCKRGTGDDTGRERKLEGVGLGDRLRCGC